MEDYVVVAREEGGEACEVDLEPNGSLGLDTLQAMFGNVSCLKYRNPTTGMVRIVRIVDGVIHPPKGGWGDTVYFVGTCTGTTAAQVRVPHQTQPSVKPRENEEAVTGEAVPAPLRSVVKAAKEEAVREPDGLSKKQLLKLSEKSLIARNAVLAWNTLNRKVRELVVETKWYGNGGFSKCEGTTVLDATKNKELRHAIISNPKVTQHFKEFRLETGETVTLGETRAGNHLRHCINEMKRPLPGDVNGRLKRADQATKEEVEVGPERQPLKECNEKSATKKGKKTVRACVAEDDGNGDDMQKMKKFELLYNQLKKKMEKKQLVNEEEKENSDVSLDEPLSPLLSAESEESDLEEEVITDFEQRRRQNIAENKKRLKELKLGRYDMADDDLVVVGKAWFPAESMPKLTTARVVEACKAIGIGRPPKSSVTESLKYLGQQLIDTQLVSCKKSSGLTRKDVKKN